MFQELQSFFSNFFVNLYQNLHKHKKKKFKTITILYNKLQYIVLQSFYSTKV